MRVINPVDEFVINKVLPDHHDIVVMIRDLMREMAPDAIETISYGIPVWRGKRIFAYFSPNKKGITFSFSRGAQFEDKYGLLKGVGKSSRHIKINNLIALNMDALRYYINQALDLDKK
jgi:hypothetical protein